MLGVAPESIGAAAGLLPGDRVLRIGSIALEDDAALARAVRAASACERIDLDVARGEQRFSRVVEVRRWPREVLDGEVHDETIVSGGVRLRLLVTAPKNTPAPAIVIVQGVSTESIDFGADPAAPLFALVRAWNDRGFATVRIEKRGAGDSEGETGGFDDELADAREALIASSAHPAIDRERIVLFGHSVGGMIAPILAREGIARAIAVYGTSSLRWYACLEASARRQLALRGVAPDEIDRRLSDLRSLPWYYRSQAFHRELDAVDLEAAWRTVDRPLLVLHGEHDYVVSREEHERIAALVPGAELVELPGLDHLFTRHGDAAASLASYGAGALDTSIAEAVADFASLVFDRGRA